MFIYIHIYIHIYIYLYIYIYIYIYIYQGVRRTTKRAAKKRRVSHSTAMSASWQWCMSNATRSLRPRHHVNVLWYRGGLVFKAHRLLYHSTLGSRVIKKEKKFHVKLTGLYRMSTLE